MIRFALRRMSVAIPMLVVVTFAVFVFIDLAPGDPAARLAGDSPTPARIQEIRESFKLDEPLLQRYGDWLGGAATGDLGTSFANRQPVTELISARLPVTLSLVFLTMVITIFVGLSAGMIAGRRAGRASDKVVTGLFSAAIALPPFWIALVLALIFAVQLGWLPSIGYTPMSAGAGEWLSHLILPAVALSLLPAAEVGLQFRSAMAEVLTKDYVMNAEAKGLPTRKILVKHASKNAAVPVVTVFGYRFAQILGGTVAIESVFDLPGLGRLAVSSVLTSDIPVLIGLVALTTMIVVVVNLLVDISYGYFNPKVRA